jgi:hypothetical protein
MMMRFFSSHIDSRFYKIGIKAALQARKKKERRKILFFFLFLCDLIMDRKIARPIYFIGTRTTTNEIYDSCLSFSFGQVVKRRTKHTTAYVATLNVGGHI